jgi:hypothetical protein
MKFWVKLIKVKSTVDIDARKYLYANCDHAVGDYWLFEGDEEFLHHGIKFKVIGERAIEGTGDLSSDEIKKMVREVYGVDVIEDAIMEWKHLIDAECTINQCEPDMVIGPETGPLGKIYKIASEMEEDK